jgi:hypothetical protein
MKTNAECEAKTETSCSGLGVQIAKLVETIAVIAASILSTAYYYTTGNILALGIPVGYGAALIVAQIGSRVWQACMNCCAKPEEISPSKSIGL